VDRKLFRSILLIITYTVFLIFLILHFDQTAGWISAILDTCKPLFIGFAIAFILHRPCRFFLRLFRRVLPEKAARPLSVVSAYAAMFAVIVAVISLIIPQLVGSIELFVSNLSGYITSLEGLLNRIITLLDLEYLERMDLSGLYDMLKNIGTNALNAMTNALPHLFAITGTLVSAVVTLVLSLVFSIYMLSGSDRLRAQFRRAARAYLPPKACTAVLSVVRLTADTFTRFISGQALEACILGSLCALGMVLLKLPYAPMIGVIIGVSALIPVAGAYLGALLSALILVMVSPVQALIFLIFLLILQQVEGNIIYPRVVGTSIGLPGLWVLAAVTVGGGIFGFLGMLLSVPVTSVIYTLLRGDVHRRLGESE